MFFIVKGDKLYNVRELKRCWKVTYFERDGLLRESKSTYIYKIPKSGYPTEDRLRRFIMSGSLF